MACDRKLVGSAQRRKPERVLHHGSIPIARNPLAPDAACLEELLGRRPSFVEVADALVSGFEEEIGQALVASEPSSEEWGEAEQLVGERFGTEGWNRKR